MNFKRVMIFGLLPTLLAVGCAAPQAPRYVGPGNQEAFLKARYQCFQEVQNMSMSAGSVGAYGGSYASMTAPSCGALSSCLATKGYTADPNGPFMTPQGTEIRCIK